MSGIGTLILVAAVMCTVLGLVSLLAHIYNLNNIKNKTVGDGQHGTARWARKEEVLKTYKHIPFTPELWREGKNLPTAQGIIVGCHSPAVSLFAKKNAATPTTALIDDSDVHALMIGAAGVGKTAYWLYPNLEYACASGMSFVTSDTKGDLYRNYGNIAKDYYGYNIAVIDLRNPTRSDGNNLLHLVNKYQDLYKADPDNLAYKAKAEKYAKIISKTIILSGMDAASFGQNAYFYDAAEGLLTATILLVAELCEPKQRHIVSVFKVIQELLAPSKIKGKNQFQLLIDKLPSEHKAKWFAGAALNTAEQSMNSVMSTALSRLNALEQVGSVLGVTRERVRQIEAKAKRLFAQWQRNHRIVSKICAERNGDSILTPIEIEEFCDENATELLFFLRSFESSTYTYDAQLDVFIVGNESISERAQEYIENLPDIFNASNLPDIYEMAKECDDIPQELLEKAISGEYRQTGDTYHRCRLSLSKMYLAVLKEHYPDGIKAYDENELIAFRRHVISTYGDVSLPENNRAITARIAGICVLCGKGKYKPKAEKYLSNKLSEKIYRYIMDSKISIFLTNTLFSEFEDELISEGVNNKYFLQGILHELFGDKFVFHRDYVSKDDSFTSIYSEIIQFIKQSDYPISKKQIQNAFPGITDIVLSLAVSDPCILNYFGEYLHSSKLKLLESDKRYLDSLITNTVKDYCAHHCQELYSIINLERPEIFTRNAAGSQFSAYSILEYLYHDLFQFSRPYIALNEVEIGRPGERLHDLIYSSDEYAISEITEFARENHFQITSLLDYLNACNDSYFIANCDMLMDINSTSATNEISQIIENMIYNEIDQTTPIFQLQCLSQFPTLDVPWTDWLIYSILKKWSTKIDVGTSSKQFRYAVPLVARHEQLCVESFINLTRSSDELVIADDLENIDDLISGYIENEVIL